MRFRGKSIRRKIVALLMVPLVALVAIWAFAALITGHGVQSLMNVKRVTGRIDHPVENTVDALAAERRAAVVYLAGPESLASVTALRNAEQRTDHTLDVVRANSADHRTRGELDGASRARLTALLGRAGALEDLRRKVDDRKVSRTAAFTAYNDEIDPYYSFFLGLDPVQSVGLDRQARVLTELDRAREILTREDALYSAAQVEGHMSRADLRFFSDAVAQQRTIYATYPPLLPGDARQAVADYWRTNPAALALHDAEERILAADQNRAVDQITPETWHTTASTVITSLATLDRQLTDDYTKRVEPYAIGVLGKAAIAGGFGLIAVIASVVVSLRIARGLVRDLSNLRKEAQEASGTRLPRVMRRLAAGEAVDIESEVPSTAYDDDEIGAVGKALNTLQRAAVEAAVRQADMRRGVSDVFVNLARRNQVLLHRQLTLLDAMERRTEETDELADLFRLDHMTTRMRRHAEGLVILSGAAPSRQWRKPVPLMDVVRAAVAEVEDYERVEVRRLPRLAVAGAAVADLTHLVAELVENGTVFSPPHTTVQVHGERVANGYVLEVDDRGLGMTPEALLDANLRLAETPEFELSDTDRLGLFVVSRLAQRHGVRVSLRPSPFGGTTAVVLVPHTLLTESAVDDPPTEERTLPGGVPRFSGEGPGSGALPDEIVVPVPPEAPGRSFHDWGMVPTVDASDGDSFMANATRRQQARLARRFDLAEQHQQASDAPGGHPERYPAEEPQDVRARPTALTGDDAPLPRRRRTSGHAPAPAAPAAPSATRDEALPRRVRQASLAPQLRDHDAVPAPPPASREQSPDDRDPDEVRARMASLQRGWTRGRAEADEDTAGPAGTTTRTTRTAATDTADRRGGDATGTTSEGDGR